MAATVFCYIDGESECAKAGGKCKVSTTLRCERLPSKCTTGKYCCKKEPTMRLKRKNKHKNKKEKEYNNSNSLCSTSGGVCQNKSEDFCNKFSIPEFCPGNKSTCCLEDDSSCKIKPSCRLRGGICLRGSKSQFNSRKILQNGCSSKQCHCYIPATDCRCGGTNRLKVIGGKEVSPYNKYPWLVGLKRKGTRAYTCGATIINNLYVVTAAHCVYGHLKQIPAEEFLVVLADHDYKSTEDDVLGVTRKVAVDKIIVHFNYDDSLPYNDIALLRLAEPLSFRGINEVGVICLPTSRGRKYSRKKGVALGWGVTDLDTFKFSSFAKEIRLPILNVNCNGLKVGGQRITQKMLCAGGHEGKDTCVGDSGGPLAIMEGGHHILVGITSFGSKCGLKGVPAVYTRVSEYLDWVVQNTRDALYCM